MFNALYGPEVVSPIDCMDDSSKGTSVSYSKC